ncbi:MAG: ankyrin repeat domain-containing protein, partial [bacterium]|nr:ankyrin repeat domain-containing protein [bacterium]
MKNSQKQHVIRASVLLRAALLAAFCLTPAAFCSAPAFAAMPDANFIDLCALGEIGAVRQAIRDGANPNAHNQYGNTALMYAVNNNKDPEVINALLEAGADINAKNDNGETALMDAALFGDGDNAEKIRALLEGKPDLNAQKTGNWEKGWTALMVAARASEAAKRIKLLLSAGADANIQGGEGETALIIAARTGKSDAVRVLLAAGANAQIQDKNGHNALWHSRNPNPLMRVSQKDSVATVQLLEQCGSPAQRAANALCREDSPEALAAQADNEFANLCKNGTTEAVRQALKNGANPNAESESGWTALMLAADENGDPEVVGALLEAGADVNRKTGRGWTALLRAVLGNDNPEVVKILLDAGADAKAMLEDESTTALMIAAEHHPDAVPALLAAGANVNAQNNYGWTALWHAAVRGHSEAVRALLAAGANVNIGIDGGGTALMSAGDAETARMLLKAGAELNARDKSGMTALMHAAQYGKKDVVKSLLFAGANRNITDGKGHDALWHAQHPEKDVDASACVPLLRDEKLSDEDFIDLCKEGTPEMVRQALKSGSNLR